MIEYNLLLLIIWLICNSRLFIKMHPVLMMYFIFETFDSKILLKYLGKNKVYNI